MISWLWLIVAFIAGAVVSFLIMVATLRGDYE